MSTSHSNTRTGADPWEAPLARQRGVLHASRVVPRRGAVEQPSTSALSRCSPHRGRQARQRQHDPTTVASAFQRLIPSVIGLRRDEPRSGQAVIARRAAVDGACPVVSFEHQRALGRWAFRRVRGRKCSPSSKGWRSPDIASRTSAEAPSTDGALGHPLGRASRRCSPRRALGAGRSIPPSQHAEHRPALGRWHRRELRGPDATTSCSHC